MNNEDNMEEIRLTEAQTQDLGKLLFSSKTTVEKKQKIMITLAHLGTVVAFRILEKYCDSPNEDEDLKVWASIALDECRMFLEMDLSDDEDGVFIGASSGRDGRFFIHYMVLPMPEKRFTESQQNIIKIELEMVAKDLNCIVESIEPFDDYVGFTVLVPVDVAFGTVIENIIHQSNELGGFVFEDYYAGTTKYTERFDIQEIIDVVYSGEE